MTSPRHANRCATTARVCAALTLLLGLTLAGCMAQTIAANPPPSAANAKVGPMLGTGY
jgi:hypothetical protein